MTIVALLYLTGLFLLFASLLLPGVPGALCSLLGGTLCGTTTLLLCIAWGSVFSTLTFREALIRLSVLLAICALINTGFVYMGPETGVASFLLLSILGLVPLLIRSTHGEFVRLLNVQRDAKSQDSTVFHSFFSVALGPFVGFLLFALTMAVRKIAVFGNMYAGELLFFLLALLGGFALEFGPIGAASAGLGQIAAGLVWWLFHVLIVLLQAFIMMMLTLVYIGQAHSSH